MDIKNFAILQGEGATVDKGRIKIPALKKVKKGEKDVVEERQPFEIRTDVLFSSGTIEFKIKAKSHSTGVLLFFNTSNNKGLILGHSRTLNSFLIGEGTDNIIPIIKAGNFSNYKLNEEHTFKISIIGSFAKLYFDNVLICESYATVKESIVHIRLNSSDELELFDFKIHSIKPKIFVVMQFTKEYNELFEDVIKPISESAGFECIRADEFYTSTPIIKDIIESIQDSTAIIAEITPDNPNVFYEIGYSHAINKPTILLCDRKREKLPFDVSSFRTLFYENTIAGKKKVEESLKKYLQNIK